MKKILILPLLGVLLFCFFGTSNSYAKEIPDIETKVKNGKYTLKVYDKGDKYKFFKNGTLLYEGPSNQLTKYSSTIGDKYKVGIYQENKLKRVVTVRVTNDLEQPPTHLNKASSPEIFMNSKIENSHIDVVAAADSVKLSWDQLPDKDGVYEIYKDNKKIAETTNVNFTDQNVKPGERYHYSIHVRIDPAKEMQKDMEKTFKQLNSQLSAKEKAELMSVEGLLSTIVDIPVNNESYLKSKKSILDRLTKNENLFSQGKLPRDNMYGWTYTTFIPYQSVKDPNPAHKRQYYFKGDNRGFDFSANKFITNAQVNTQFHSPTSIALFKEMGKIIRCYDPSCRRVKEKKSISGAGIKRIIHKKERHKLEWTVTHSVENPFGSYYPKTDYSYRIKLTENRATITGEHLKAPNHEFYLSTPAIRDYIIVHQYEVKSKKEFWELWFSKSKISWKTELS
ncbi:hypothetical protein PJ311_07200 [Bacillus sp. CLL-7-23]|uniref:DUF3238 domain-containing protein n=1 Tax=Bacillus changyiensis TaxID=3004103 RepID=A0ABT4X266_9BACI|nr:hypothetical protein [Bacillus changyiensis]MDA7026403.1 hypothetical protein [Bacillus changyiensis]